MQESKNAAINNTLVSVIMPAYNAEKYITESIQSVQQQTHSNWELIIIDDGSTDNTKTLVLQFAKTDTRIKYFFQQNGKQGRARNNGIRQASGNLIAFLDADDLWLPEKLEKQILFIDSAKADIVFADVMVIDEKRKKLKDSWGVQKKSYAGSAGIIAFLKENKMPLLTVLAKKESIQKVNGFKESDEIQYGEDYELWLKMLQNNFAFAGSNEKLAIYRQHETQSTKNTKAMLQVISMLSSLKVTGRELIAERNKTICLWIRRFIKTSAGTLNKNDLALVIACLPFVVRRKIFFFLNTIMSTGLVSKLVLLNCRSAIEK